MLPVPIKPLLYCFDNYQTHDLVGWNLCSSIFQQPITYLNNLKLHNDSIYASFDFEGDQKNQILIQRFTPWSYPWADNYSTKLYDFIQHYTGTDIYDSDEYTNRSNPGGVVIDFGGGFSAPISVSYYNKPVNTNIRIRILPTTVVQSVVITWLQDTPVVPDECLLTPNKIYKKEYKIVNTSTTEITTVELEISKLVSCSMVFSGDVELINYIKSFLPPICFYECLDDLLNNLKYHIEIKYPRLFFILETARYRTRLDIRPRYMAPEFLGDFGQGSQEYFGGTIWTGYTYRTRPEYYRSACLLHANYNRWNEAVSLKQDLGKTPTFYEPIPPELPLTIKYFFFIPYTEKCPWGTYESIAAAEADGYPNVAKVKENQYDVFATYIQSPPFVNPYAEVRPSRPATTYDPNTGSPILTPVAGNETEATDLNPFFSYTISAPSIDQRDLLYYRLFPQRPNITTVFNSGETERFMQNRWHEASHPARPLNSWKGLIKNASGAKYYLFHVGSQVLITQQETYKNYFGQQKIDQPLEADYFHFKINCVATLKADWSFSLQANQFVPIGNHHYTGETYIYPNSISSPPSSYWTYEDSYRDEGQITWNYYTSDGLWASDPYIIKNGKPEFKKVAPSRIVQLIDDCIMPDSPILQEILDCCQRVCRSLDAQKFSHDDNSPEPRVANLGYYIERIARVLGISVNSNGTIRSIRQKRVIPRPNLAIALPDGWNFGQWGLNRGGGVAGRNPGQLGGNSSDYRDGIIYEQRSNKLESSRFNPNETSIKAGDYTLCENIPQLLDEILDDLDKGIGWQELGAGAVPNADGSGKYCTFEGLAQLLTETAYMMSRVSQHTSQTQVATLVVQAVAYEILRATGQPLTPKSFQVDVGGEDYAVVPYPGLAPDAPSQMEQTSWILQNLAPILGAFAKINAEEVVPPPPQPQPTNTTST